MEIIQLKEVSKHLSGRRILEDINLTIDRGDIIGIIGQSGSGKTTLLNLIAGFTQPSQGEVVYFSKVDHKPKSLHKHFNKIKKHLAFMPQHTSFYPKLTVKENILHFGRLYGVKRKTLVTNAKALLEFTELYEHRNKLASHLSGGMQKRLDITCCLTHKPKVLLLDEPTADLDPVLQEEVLKLIQEVNKQGITIVIASHHLESLEKICTKIGIITNGTLESYGEVEDVRRPFLKKNTVINVKVGKDKDKILNFVRQLPVSKIVDQGHQLVLYPIDKNATLSSLLQVVAQEHLFLNDIDLRKTSFNEIFRQIATK